MRYVFPSIFFIAFLVSIFGFSKINSTGIADDKRVVTVDLIKEKPVEKNNIKKENTVVTVQASQFVTYAKTLAGTPYLYGSVDPARGLDCSGFVNCVSDHFGMKVPRSSAEFTDLGTTIETNKAEPGDLILFTGTNASTHTVGHIGIITDNIDGEVKFIHSSSGNAHGVIISELSGYYQSRLVKVIRIFPTAADKIAG